MPFLSTLTRCEGPHFIEHAILFEDSILGSSSKVGPILDCLTSQLFPVVGFPPRSVTPLNFAKAAFLSRQSSIIVLIPPLQALEHSLCSIDLPM